MSDVQRLTDVAAAVADGVAVDWGSGDLADPPDRDTLVNLHAVASISRLFANISSGAARPGAGRAPLQAGVGWGSLRIIEPVGRGRFGDVYRAWDPALDREVALKLIDDRDAESVDTQVIEEGRLMARVRHPNVVTVYGAQRADGLTGLWMEFIEGRTLAAIVRDEGRLDAVPAARVGIDICAALAAVHACGLLHGDVKAQNVMRDNAGRIVLMDFGTGRVAAESDRASRLAGTPLYLAPEVLNGAAPNVRSDVYSAGVLLYHLLTGAYPVEGRSLDELRAAHVGGARTGVRDRRIDVPHGLAAVVDRAIASDPAVRFESATALERALSYAAGRHRSALWRRATLSAAATILVASIAGIGWWRSAPRAKAPAETVTTASADALRLYYRSYELGFSDDWKSALALVRQAIAADHTFALAHTWEAWCLRNTGAAPTDVAAVGKRAVEMSSGVSEWERLWIQASYDRFTNNTDEEIPALLALVRLRPDHFWAVSNLAGRLSALERYHDAVPYAVQGANLRPTSGFEVSQTAWILLKAGETDKALDYAHRVRVMVDQRGWFSGAHWGWLVPLEALWRRGDIRGAAEALDAARTDCAVLSGEGRLDLARRLVTWNLSLGRWRAARLAADVIEDPNWRHFNRGIAAFHANDRVNWRHEVSLVSTEAGGQDARTLYLIEAGQVDAAQWEVDHSDRLPPGALPVLQGILALARGDRRQALVLLESARPAETWTGSIYRYEYLAKLYLAQGHRERAIQTLQESLNHRSIPALAVWWMRNELRLAELYHDSVRDADARPLEAEMDKWLAAADPDFPLLVRLKALKAMTPSATAAFSRRD